MHSPAHHTAVLLFALPDAVEADRKPVARSSVWRAMRGLARAKVHAAGLPLLESNRLIDHRGTFGEQLSAAISAVFARGYERVICIGNDSPDLSTVDLRRAAQALNAGRLPVGADRRGGVYLVGFDRARFDGNALTQLPWQTTRLASSLHDYFVAQGTRPTELPTRADINHRADATAVRWFGQVASRLVSVIRQALLPTAQPRMHTLLPGASLFVPDRLSGRAPPLLRLT